MLWNRVIPCLLIANGALVKTRNFKNPKYVGDPTNAIKIFNEKEVDEIIVLDILASKEGREPNYENIEKIAGECFMPLCYGGGISDAQQAGRLFSIGVEKVSINTSAYKDINIIANIAARYGSQAVVASVNIKRNFFGKYQIYSHVQKEYQKINFLDWIADAVSAGAGEIMINSVDNDGMMNGLDLDLIKLISKNINIPLITIGGVGSIKDIKNGFAAGANAVSAGSFFVFHGQHRAVLITYPKKEELI